MIYKYKIILFSLSMFLAALQVSCEVVDNEHVITDSGTQKVQESASITNATRDRLRELLNLMDIVGPDSTSQYEQALEKVVHEPNLVLLLRELSVTTDDPNEQWRISYIASQVESPESVAFLRELAYSQPVVHPSPDGDRKDESFAIRTQAAFGLAQSYESNVPGSKDAIEDVLRHADEETSRLLAVGLFSSGNLTEPWRKILDSRGIFSDFRLLSPEESQQLFELHPDQDGHRGDDTRKRPRSTSVPSEEEYK